MRHLSATELAARVAMPTGFDDVLDGGPPVVFVEDDGGAEDLSLGSVPVVVVGPAPAEHVDVVADGGDVDAVVTGVSSRPIAAVSLVLLLRGAASRSVAAGLVAESSTYSMLQAGPEHTSWLAALHRPSPAGAGGPTVAVSREGGVLHVTLDRPEVHNAFSARMRDELVDALAVAVADPELRVVLDGAGPSFCSGGDLTEFGSRPDPASAHLVRARRSAGHAIAAVADRTEVRVHGTCVGAGVELPAFAGRVAADPATTFRLPEVAMGLVPGAGGTVSITARIGRHRAGWMALTDQSVDAPTALAWGLVDELSGPT